MVINISSPLIKNRQDAYFTYLADLIKMPSVGFEPTTNGLCLPATAFAARFRFVVWTFSSLYALAVKSLRLPFFIRAWLGIIMCLLTFRLPRI